MSVPPESIKPGQRYLFQGERGQRLRRIIQLLPDGRRLQALNVETCRLAGTVTRMMNTYQQGMATLQKMRTGGTQRIVVQRMQQVNVQEGAQAIVGNEQKVTPSGGGGGRRKRGGI